MLRPDVSGRGLTWRRGRTPSRLKAGDLVVRRHRLLKTRGTVLRFDGEDDNGGSRAWIKWNHPTTLPNPSLESVDDLELVESDRARTGRSPMPAGGLPDDRTV